MENAAISTGFVAARAFSGRTIEQPFRQYRMARLFPQEQSAPAERSPVAPAESRTTTLRRLLRASGIGFATAKRFAREGAHVFITGRRQSELDKAKAGIGDNVTTVQGDVTTLTDLDRLYAVIKAEKGVVDIVVANAGFIEHAQISDMSEAHYDKTMDINVKGVVFTVQKVLPLMTRGGSIVVVSSVVNVKGIPAHGIYTAAKAGVRALVRVWAQELKDRGIRVNSLSPGATETPIIRGQFDSDEASDAAKDVFASATPLGRLGQPEEIAAGAYYLASDESTYVTGIDVTSSAGLPRKFILIHVAGRKLCEVIWRREGRVGVSFC